MVNTFRQYASLSSCLKPWGNWENLVLDCQYSILEMRRVYKRGRKMTRAWMLYECCKNAVWVNRAGWTFSPLSHISYFLQLDWISIYIRKHSTELRKLSSYFAVFLKQASTVTCKLMLQLDICHSKCEWKVKNFFPGMSMKGNHHD